MSPYASRAPEPIVEPGDAPQVVSYASRSGVRYGVMLSGTPCRIVYLAPSGVTLRRLAGREVLRCRSLPDYPPRRAMRKLLSSGRSLGISQSARKALRGALNGASGSTRRKGGGRS